MPYAELSQQARTRSRLSYVFRGCRGERGFTMIELLVATLMMVVISGATVSLFISTLKHQSRITSSAHQVNEARVALRNIIDDVRQGSTISTATASELKLKTYIHATACTGPPSVSAAAIQCTVTYKFPKETSKTTYEATRTIESTTVKVARGLSSNSVFTYTPSATPTAATYIAAKLALPTGSGATTLENGAALRNASANLGY